MSSRSLRTEYNICNNCARNNCSGGIDGRPTFEYILLNCGDSCFRIGDVAEHVTLLLIASSHAPLDVLYVASLHALGVFQQPVSAQALRDSRGVRSREDM